MPSAICFHLDQSKILSFGNGLKSVLLQEENNLSTDRHGIMGKHKLNLQMCSVNDVQLYLHVFYASMYSSKKFILNSGGIYNFQVKNFPSSL